ncbi:TetR/AcrR family transcriptional regulator [Actinosynnema sp. NPDC023587]|uniref:TetR/AcrR family transcriptional regulator n=1 Tax=Actinosynnema sp. NPDC023587 TaxID=3154695 RepID=UPI0033E8A950
MARSPSLRDDELSDRLAEVFRSAGYGGASLGALSEAAGLRRASLYHRFPDGKVQMAEAVLERVERLFVHALRPMGEEPDVRTGITRSALLIGELYGGGLLSCVMDSMTLGGVPEPVRRRAAEIAEVWISTMADAATREGRAPASARAAAEDAFALMEGGLVHGRLFGDSGPFRRALTRLPDLLLDRRTD